MQLKRDVHEAEFPARTRTRRRLSCPRRLGRAWQTAKLSLRFACLSSTKGSSEKAAAQKGLRGLDLPGPATHVPTLHTLSLRPMRTATCPRGLLTEHVCARSGPTGL